MGATPTDPTGENPLMNVDDSNAPQQPMEEDDNDEQQQQLNGEEEDVVDETPAFVSADDAVEVQVDDDQAMMDDDDDEDDDAASNKEEEMNDAAADDAEVPDLSHVQLTSHTGPVYAVRAYLRDDNNSLAIVTGGGDDKAFVHRVTTTSTSSATTLPLSHPHTDSVSAVAWNVHYVSTPTSSNSTANNNNPRLCAVGGYDGAIALYDANDENAANDTTLIRVLEGPTDVECLAWHPKGGTVLLAGSAADGTLWMYHTGLQGKVLQVFVGHEAGVSACDFTADGKHAVSASSDGTLRIWAPRTGQCKHVFRFQQQDNGAAGLTCLAVGGGADRQLLLVGAEDGHAHVCHGATQKVVAQLTHADASNNAPGENDDEAEGAALSVEAVGFSPSHPQWCATAGVDGVLKIWDLSTSSTPHCRQVCRLEGVGGGLTRLVWHPTLPLVFTASTAGTVDLWDARDGTQLHTLTGHAPNIPLNDMDVHIRPDNGHAVVVSGSDDHTVRVFDVNVPALWNRQPPTESQA